MEESANALLEQILRSVRDQSVLADRRHEAQTAFNAQVSQQLQSISKQLAASLAASAPEAAESMLAKVARECGGDISASQEEILANSSFLGGDNALPASDDEEEEEVFSTPPDAIQQQDDPVTVCTPTLYKSRSPAPPDNDAPPAKKASVYIRGARMSTEQEQQPQPQTEQTAHVDPLDRAVLMIPTKPTDWCSSPSPVQDFLALCRRKCLI